MLFLSENTPHQGKANPTQTGSAMGRAAQVLGLSKDELSAVVGKHRTTIDRSGLDPKTKEGELALLLLRVDRSLHALYGGDQALMRQRIEGLTRVANTLDALRG